MKMTGKGSDLISRSIWKLSEGNWDKKENLSQVNGTSVQFEPDTSKTNTILTSAIRFP
jgi:hypothetical protein